MTFTFLYVTTANEKEAFTIARHLLNRRLVACANLFPIQSLYWWKGKIQEGKETVVILKTIKEKVALTRKEIKKIHSYSIPGITEITVRPNEQYGQWLQKQLA